ncbi:SDR family NAD(P)-dependent oxidoreductase [Saccharothrix xinjiangensis]|uniref:SDR family NAD(P)-dependent oxidoreductase n=1 Tax=Saccharothrix xinjiangensis TaxID=204798 RepID=A0ABV9Y5F0_9PSEU
MFDAVRDSSAVAIVGVGCRLPGGVRSLDGLWEVLDGGRDLVGTVPEDRFDSAGFVSGGGARPGKSYTAAGGFLDDVAGFDARFFGISPKEASRIDPQQRLVLECAVEALDDAGIAAADLAGGDTAVLIGVSSHDYGDLQMQRSRSINPYSLSGMASCNAANRVSYALDLHGESAAVDTACSSALVAVHRACEVLRSGRGGLALAGGVNVLLSPSGFIGFSQASMLSPTGRCRPFSARADGFVRAEGAGVLVLKPLAAALADGDRVHAVIRASGTNTDGRTGGLALPNPRAQADLLERVYAEAGVAPEEVAYVEAHGTGTQAGDPAECTALGQALGRRRNGAGPLPIGSVKSNLGHLEAAAGIPGLLKAVLVLRERRIPATLHLDEPRAEIDFTGLGLCPVSCSSPLSSGDGPAVVGVSGFGFGGVNAHLVLTDAPPVPASDIVAHGALPVLVTAHTAEALTEAARRWADLLERTEPARFYDVAYTSCRRRGRHGQRIAALATDPGQAASALRALADGDAVLDGAAAEAVARGRIGFVFDGNGSQWAGMGRELLAEDAAFRAEVVLLDEVLTPLLGWSVSAELATPDPGRWELTEVAQPLLFVVQAGLVAALAARGVTPAAVTGHSVGEVAAAYCAGALDRAAACRVVAERSRAQAAAAGTGRMAAIGLDAPGVELLLAETGCAGKVWVAAVNSPRDVTVSGAADALGALAEAARERGVFFRDLELDYPFHSPVMDALRDDLVTALSGAEPRDCRIALVSAVTGEVVDGAGLDAEYWWRNVRRPVLFADAVTALVRRQGCDVLVEIGPHPVLGAYLRRVTAECAEPVAIVPTTTRAVAGTAALDAARARLVAVGADVDWTASFPRPGRVVDLPALPWQRERHWNGHPDWWLEGPVRDVRHRSNPLLGDRHPGPDPVWSHALDPDRLGWLADHRVGDAVVMPAAGHLDLALAAGRELFDGPVELVRVAIERALSLPWGDRDDPGDPVHLHTAVGRDAGLTVSSRTGDHGDWTDHVRGRVRRSFAGRPPALDVPAVTARLSRTITAEEHYANCARAGLPYGPAFRTVTRLRAGDDEVLAEYTTAVEPDARHQAHPTLLDGALQAALLLACRTADPVAYLPVGFDAVRCWQAMPATGLAHVRLLTADHREVRWDLVITDPDGTVALELSGCRARLFAGTRPTARTWLVETLRAAPLPGTPAAPSPLPAPPAVMAAAKPALAALSERWQPDTFAELRLRTREMVSHFTAAALRDLLPDRTDVTIPALAEAGVLPEHHRVLAVLIDLAARHGLLTAIGEQRWTWGAGPRAHEVFRAVLADHPQEATAHLAHGVCGRHLAAVLRGERDPLDLLFAEPDTLAARMYDSSGLLRHHNRVAAELVRALVAQWPADRPLRVLEVGAGTGGVTASLLPLLPADRTRYTYTDVSPAFFPAAAERFAAFDFLDHRVLDLDTDPVEQGFTPGSFDLVVAANVLHATRDLTRTLHRVRELLAEGGQLLALEFHDLDGLAATFGLLRSFWEIEDPDLRPLGPMPARQSWPGLLARCGFRDVVQTEDDTCGDHSVLLAARGDRPAPVAVTAPDPAATGTRRWLIGRLPGAARPPVSEQEVLSALGATRAHHVVVDEDALRWTALLSRGRGPVDVVLLAGTSEGFASAEVTEQAVRHCAVLRALAAAEVPEHVEVTVWVVVPARQGTAPVLSAGAAALWGAARTLANEHPRLTTRRVALTGTGDALAGHLAREFSARSDDDEVLLTAGGRFVPRLHAPVDPLVPSRGSYTLTLSDHGPRYRLGWQTTAPPTPGRGEVVVAVEAAALNYRDVMIATGLVPAPPRRRADTAEIGFECAGEVVAVGADVTGRALGDRVVCVTTGCFGSHVAAPVEQTLPVPAGTTCAEAVTLPLVALTVHHALHRLARLSAGETVLVHGAAGGVGLAALQYARHVGAHVIATAGTPAKRDLLHLLGVEHVLDSRSLHFADQVRDLTHGRGVDVVLNSLAGEALVRGLEVVKPHGRFLELGKRDFLADTSLPLAPFTENLSLFGVDLSAAFTEPEHMATALAEADGAIRSGTYRTLPHRVYPAGRIREAFTCLQHSRHTGKVVITFDEPVPVTAQRVRGDLDADAAYLVTGGLGGFGAATARHLATRGARHLVLISRRGLDAPGAGELLADLRALGAHVEAHAADAADPTAINRVLAGLDASGRRLAGVVHAAMVLHDAPLTDLTDDHLRAVLTPKLTAGHLLDRLTRHRDLDFFVAYSSVASCVGNVRQAPYVAANAALEALVRDRRRAGLPGLAVQWGGIGDTGYIHRTGRTEELGRLFDVMPVAEALRELDDLLDRPDAEVVVVGDIHWDRMARFLPAFASPRTAAVLSTEQDTAADRLRDALAKADHTEAHALIEDALTELLARVLQTTPDRVDRGRRLDQLGVDSLMAAEFTTAVNRSLGCHVAVVEMVGAPSVTALAQRLHSRLGRSAPGTDAPATGDGDIPDQRPAAQAPRSAAQARPR